MAYTVLRFAKENGATDQQDVISDVSSLQFTHILSGAGRGSFTIPRDSPQIADLVFGTVLRIMDHDDTHVWTGVVSGTIEMGDGTVIRIPMESLIRRLADFIYPPTMLLEGSSSIPENAARLTQCYNWRTVTANKTTGTSSIDNDEIVSLGGDDSVNQTGKLLVNTILWDVYQATEDDDSSGVLTISGTDKSGDGILNDPQYAASGTYRGPYINMAAPVGLDASEIRLDRLRYGGAWMDDDEVKYKVTTYASEATARSTIVGAGDSTETDPEGVGADITVSSSNDFVEVQFLLTPDERDSTGVMIQWYQVTTRQVIPGISAGNFPTKDFENQMDVGGRTLLDVLETIADTFAMEYRARITGEIDMQSIPLTDEWIASIGATTGTWDDGEVVTGQTSLATAFLHGIDEDAPNKLRLFNTGGIPAFVTGETLKGGVSNATAVYTAPLTVGTFWGDERQESYHFVDEIHCNIKSYTQDDSELTNFLSVIGTGNGQNAVEVILQNAASQNTYGVRQRSINLGLPLLTDLKSDGKDYMLQRTDPRKLMVIEVIAHPSFGQVSLGVGDRVRVTSSRLTGFDGADIDDRLRITEISTRVTESGDIITLNLETRPGTKTFTQTIAKSLARADADAGRSLGGISMSVMETSAITTHGSSTDFTIRLPFQPVNVSANVLEVYDIDEDVWYSPSGGVNIVRVVKEMLADRSVIIGIREIGGSATDYIARIEWKAWGDVDRSGSLGR